MRMGRRGFTLIELLVVIAIIGILAAMLFPVFARAREAARKIQCLSNVKNVAMAMQMYLTDYDRMPPGMHDQGAMDWFNTFTSRDECPQPVWMANPYLRWHVILDEYVKNRDVYRCPSARNVYTPRFILPGNNWVQTLKDNGGPWSYCICEGTWPPGWGGTVTDSCVDGCPSNRADVSTNSPELDIMFLENFNTDKSMSQVNDPARYVLVVERGMSLNIWAVEQIAYPELCRSVYGQAVNNPEDCSREDQPDFIIPTSQIEKFWNDATMRRPWTRHMGGNNMGFADGHAKWWDADALLAAAGTWDHPEQQLEGIPCRCMPDAPMYQ